MTAPFFSIILPVYNRNEVLRRALRSCIEQTFTNFEVIVVDDGSQNSEEIFGVVDSFNDVRIRYIHRENGGGSAARNTGIDVAIGRYVAFLDSDDTFLQTKLSLAYDYLSRQTNEKSAWFSKIFVDRGISKIGIKPPRGPFSDERIDEYLIRRRGVIQSSALVVSREIAQQIRWDENLPYGQDTDFVIRLWEYGVDFFMYPKPLINFNDTEDPGRISSSQNYHAMLDWTERMGDRLTRKTALAYNGWHAAKAARSKQPLVAFNLYFIALIKGAFSPKVALISGLQVGLGARGYRRLVDLILSVVGHSK